MMLTPTLTFPLGALVRFGCTFTRPPTPEEILAGTPLRLIRDPADGWQVLAPWDGDGIAATPTTVRLRVLDPTTPTANETIVELGVDVELVAIGVGDYQADLVDAANLAGTWRYRWEATGEGQSATPDLQYRVAGSVFA